MFLVCFSVPKGNIVSNKTQVFYVRTLDITFTFQNLHCKEKELRGLSPNFHIQVSVSDLYIPTAQNFLGPFIFL